MSHYEPKNKVITEPVLTFLVTKELKQAVAKEKAKSGLSMTKIVSRILYKHYGLTDPTIERKLKLVEEINK